MIDLENKYLEFIKNTVNANLSNCKIYIFGSRVKGSAKKYSDIDIALESEDINEKTLQRIKNEFENSSLPYEVDVIDINNISETFKNHIINDIEEIQ